MLLKERCSLLLQIQIQIVVVILGAHWDLVLVAVCVARQYPPLLLKEIVSVNSNQVVVYLVHHGESLVLPSDF